MDREWTIEEDINESLDGNTGLVIRLRATSELGELKWYLHTLSRLQMDTKFRMAWCRPASGVLWEIAEDIPQPNVSLREGHYGWLSSPRAIWSGQKNLSWTPFTPVEDFDVRPSAIWRRTRWRRRRAIIGRLRCGCC